jgi:hypothetical protein
LKSGTNVDVILKQRVADGTTGGINHDSGAGYRVHTDYVIA